MITWSTGANKAIQEAASDKEFPKVFAIVLKNDSPLWATIITGSVCTVLLIIAGYYHQVEKFLKSFDSCMPFHQLFSYYLIY